MVALLVLGAADEMRAQRFHLGTWTAELEGVVDFAHQNTTTGGAPQTQTQSRHTEERISLATSGAHLYDPRLLTLSLGGTFGLSQDAFTTDEFSSSPHARLWAYDAFARLLSRAPVSFNLFANRNQSFLSAGFAGRTDVLAEARGATVLARRLYIPSTVTLRQEHWDQETRLARATSRRENRANIITYEGQRGWTDSEMRINYQFADEDDEIFPNLSYESHDGSLTYGLDFGTELNRHWLSRGRYFTRSGGEGLTGLTTATADELLRIDHSRNLRTRYRYSLVRTETSGGDSTTHTGISDLRHKLYENLTTEAGVETIIQRLTGGRRDIYGGRLDFAYVKSLPADGRLLVGLEGRFRYEEDQFSAAESFVPQETHIAASPFALRIPLDNPFVVISSVEITKVALGPLPPGCVAPPDASITLALGQDYTLDTVGDVTEIVPISCAGTIPGINPGDTIAVDYSFAVPTDLDFTTATWHVNLSADFSWIRPYYTHQQVEQTLVSGRGGQFLNDEESDVLGIELRRTRERSRARLLVEVGRLVSDRQSFNNVRSAQSFDYHFRRGLILRLSADQAHFDFADPNRKRDSFAGLATLTYAISPSIVADASAGVQALEESSLPSERRLDALLRLRWRMQKLEIHPSLEFFDVYRGDTDTREVRVLLRTIRRF